MACDNIGAYVGTLTTNFANFEIFRELRTTVYPSNMAPIGLKLGQNAFQTIPDISYFDVENFSWGDIFGRGLRV